MGGGGEGDGPRPVEQQVLSEVAGIPSAAAAGPAEKVRFQRCRGTYQYNNVKYSLFNGHNVFELQLQRLRTLVKEHTKPAHSKDGKFTKQRTNWKAVGKAMGVVPLYCLNKWTALQKKGFV